MHNQRKPVTGQNEEVLGFPEMVDQLAERTGITKKLAKEIIASMVDLMEENLYNHKAMVIRNFGALECYTIDSYKGHDFEGNEITIPPRRCVRFRPCQQLRARIKYDNPEMRMDWNTGRIYVPGDKYDPNREVEDIYADKN